MIDRSSFIRNWPSATSFLIVISGAIVICFLKNSIAKGFALGRV